MALYQHLSGVTEEKESVNSNLDMSGNDDDDTDEDKNDDVGDF